MTKEELKKEAEEYATHNDWFEFSANVDEIGNAIRTKMERAYLASAEPREKRIAELEQELAEYKEVFGSCETCKRTCDMGNCCDPRTKNGYLLDKVKGITERQKLLKENAELKARVEKQNADILILKGLTERQRDQLTNAKKIIKEFMKYEINEYDGSLEIHFEELKKQAEQFLKDCGVEK